MQQLEPARRTRGGAVARKNQRRWYAGLVAGAAALAVALTPVLGGAHDAEAVEPNGSQTKLQFVKTDLTPITEGTMRRFPTLALYQFGQVQSDAIPACPNLSELMGTAITEYSEDGSKEAPTIASSGSDVATAVYNAYGLQTATTTPAETATDHLVVSSTKLDLAMQKAGKFSLVLYCVGSIDATNAYHVALDANRRVLASWLSFETSDPDGDGKFDYYKVLEPAVPAVTPTLTVAGSEVSRDSAKLTATLAGDGIAAAKGTIDWYKGDKAEGEKLASTSVANGAASTTVDLKAEAADSTVKYTAVYTPAADETAFLASAPQTVEVQVPADPAPVATPDDQLTDATKGKVAVLDGLNADGAIVPGTEITVQTGVVSGTVHIWLHSDPRLLGTVSTDADGKAKVTVPADAAAGDRRLVVQGKDGALDGWSAVTIAATDTNTDTDGDGTVDAHDPAPTDPNVGGNDNATDNGGIDATNTSGTGDTDGLAHTGADAATVAWLGAASGVLLLGGAALVWYRRMGGKLASLLNK